MQKADRSSARIAAGSLSLATAVVAGWPILLAALGLGITYAESGVNPQFDRSSAGAVRMSRASDFGIVMFAVLQLACAAVPVASGFPRIRVHWVARLFLFVLVTGGLCYGLVLVTVMCGGAPGPIRWMSAVVSGLLERVAGVLG